MSMPKRTRRLLFALAISLALLLPVLAPAITRAQSPQGEDQPEDASQRPFQLPFAEPPGPETWLMGQPYGNTVGAYFQRNTLYVSSGGIHFGLDLPAPCGTEIVAIADGVVFAVDGPFGSAPHNLTIDHPQLGYASMYGHLLEAPDLVPGQRIEQGEVIALVGDSLEICHRRPHLHLEIRDLNHFRKYNPLPLIEADWDSLTLIGDSGPHFMRDLAEPRKWQTLYDQPEAWTGGPIINDFEATWPLDWSQRDASSAKLASPAVAESAGPATAATQPLLSTPVAQQVTQGECCTNPHWDQDSTEVRFIDQPAPDEPLGVWGVDVTQPAAGPRLITERLGVPSPDGVLIAYPDRVKGVAIVEWLADGLSWEVDTQGGHDVSFTPDSQGLVWAAYDEDQPWDTREETIWTANVDGSNARALLSERRTDPIAWLNDDELLMVRGFEDTSDVQLFKLSLKDGAQTILMEGTRGRMRDLALSPDKRHLVYYVRLEPDPDKNGVWLMDLADPAAPQKLPFFGTYRWRDEDRLIYVPFDLDAGAHNFYQYDLRTDRTRPLFPDGTNLTIANNDWQVSPDGGKIALVAAQGTELDGIWVMDIEPDYVEFSE